jgi:hypothetical protein
MKLIIKQGDWTTKVVEIKDASMMTLKNGRVIPTASNMLRNVEKESKKESLIVWVAVIAIVLGLIIGVVETLNYFA